MREEQEVGMPAGWEEERALWCGLAMLVGWSAPRFCRFVKSLEADIRGWLDGQEAALECDTFEFLTKSQRKKLGNLRRMGATSLSQRMKGWKNEVIVFGEEDYPEGLYALKRPPAALHVRGRRRALRKEGIAVVGSRKIGVSTASAARRILEPAVRRGMVVISGGALGADAVAHRAAVDCGGVTVAVLPSGLSNLSPKSNRRLFGDMVENGGLLVSEYPPGCGVRRYHFRRRNRLMAAMSRGVLVLRAAKKSGTMLTVKAARQLKRPLAALPGTPDDPLSRGCHDILRRGGRLVAVADDLLDWWVELGGLIDDGDGIGTNESVSVTMPECAVLDCAQGLVDSQGAFSMEALVRETGKSAAELQARLLEHELAGFIERTPGGDRFRFCN